MVKDAWQLSSLTVLHEELGFLFPASIILSQEVRLQLCASLSLYYYLSGSCPPMAYLVILGSPKGTTG